MDKQTEMEIRAQAMINALGQQRLESADRVVFLAADLAVAQAKIMALQNEIAAQKPEPESAVG